MSREEKLEDTPTGKVGEVVQGFVDDGATEIRVERNSSGTWDVTAYFK